MDENDDLKEIVDEEEQTKKIRRNPKKCCRYFCCIPNLLCLIMLTLITSIIIVGITGFSFFLSESITFANVNRRRDFDVICEKVRTLLTGPKIMADTMSSALEANVLNFTSTSFEELKEFAFEALHKNYERFQLVHAGMGLANKGVTKYFSFSEGDGEINYLRRFEGLDNITDQIYVCRDFNLQTLECNPGGAKYEYWNSQGSITTRSASIYERKYVSPYPFYCPGSKCDLYLSYTSPVHRNGEYEGMAGFYFTSTPARKILQEETLVGTSFIFDVQTGYIVGGSRDDIVTLQDDGTGTGKKTQISAKKHPSEDIKKITNLLYFKYNDQMDAKVTKNQYSSLSTGTENIDMYRYSEDGIDFLIVRFFPKLHYFTNVIVFSVVFSFILVVAIIFSICCCCLITCSIDIPLRRLARKMKKVETLDLSGIKQSYSMLGEVNSLEIRFYFLLNKLEEYVAFLPQFLSQQTENEEVNRKNDVEYMVGGHLSRDDGYESDRSTSTSTTSTASISKSNDHLEARSNSSSEHSSNRSRISSGVRSVDKVRKNRLTSNSIEERYVSLVRVQWLYNRIVNEEEEEESDNSSDDDNSRTDDCVSESLNSHVEDTELGSSEYSNTQTSSTIDEMLRKGTTQRNHNMMRRTGSTDDHDQFFRNYRKNDSSFDYLFRPNFIKQHTQLTNLILRLSDMKGGTVSIISDEVFQIAFNVDKKFRKHWNRACAFSLDLFNQGRKRRYDLAISVVTEKCCAAVLGCHRLKNKVIVGKINTIAQNLCTEIVRRSSSTTTTTSHPIRILTTKKVAKLCDKKEYKITPIDIMYYPNLSRSQPFPIFELSKNDQLHDSEWMYQLDLEKKRDHHMELIQIHNKLLRGKLDPSTTSTPQSTKKTSSIVSRKEEDLKKCMKKLRKRNTMFCFQKAMKKMLKAKIGYSELCHYATSRKKKMYRGHLEGSYASIFNSLRDLQIGLDAVDNGIDDVNQDPSDDDCSTVSAIEDFQKNEYKSQEKLDDEIDDHDVVLPSSSSDQPTVVVQEYEKDLAVKAVKYVKIVMNESVKEEEEDVKLVINKKNKEEGEAQWGDEGKGKLVDLIVSKEVDIVARYNGGANAGHTIVFGGNTYKFNLMPSGICQPHTINIIGNGTVIHMPKLMDECKSLDQKGIKWEGRLKVSKRAHLLFDFHQIIDGLREKNLGGKKIGTTKRGIGPCYSSKMNRHNLRAGDIEFWDTFVEKLRYECGELQKMYGFEYDIEGEIKKYEGIRKFLLPLLIDSVSYLHRACCENKKIMIEGANAIMLDIDFGTYPYVTSSNTGVSGCASGLGIPPKRITNACGVMKAYCTRVGGGPFPTELHGAQDEALRKEGREFGVTTGRARRCGWLDLMQLKYAIMINDFDTLGMTKIDCLHIFDEVKVGVAYKYEGKVIDFFPSQLEVLEKVEVVYETFPGWKGQDLTKCRTFSDLPKNAQVFVRRIEEILNVPIKFIGVGPGRKEVITQYPFIKP